MVSTRFGITGGLTPELVKLILDDVHQLLAEVGVELDHPALLKELADHTGVTVKGNRVCYDPALVEAAAEAVREAVAGVDYVIGDLSAQLTFEYDRLNLPQSEEDDFGVYLRIRRDIPNVLAIQ